VEKDGYDLGAQRREIEKNDLPIIQQEVKEYLDGLRNGKEVNSQKLTFVPKEKIITSSDIGLSYDRYSKKEIINSTFPLFELKEVVDFKRGTSITKKDVIDGDIPVIAGGQNPAYFHNESNRIGETITVSSSGAYSGFVNYFNTPIFASDCFTISPKDENTLRPKFLFHLLKSRQLEIYSRQVGGGQPHIYPKSFDDFEIPLPPIEVQEEIVRELEQYQKIIDGAKQVVDNYKPVIDIDLSVYPTVSISDVCQIFRGGSPRPIHEYITTDLSGENWIKIGDVAEGSKYIESTKERITQEGARRSRRVEVGDFILSNSMSFGRPYIMNIAGYIHDGWLLLKYSKEKLTQDYLWYILSSNAVYNQFRNKAIGGVVNNLNKELVSQVLIPLPPIEVQEEINCELEQQYKIIEGNKKLIEIYTQKIQDRINKIWGN
jgi:type I restriction enzyme M protein